MEAPEPVVHGDEEETKSVYIIDVDETGSERE